MNKAVLIMLLPLMVYFVSADSFGVFSYLPGYDYSVYVNDTSESLIFVNTLNSLDYFVVPHHDSKFTYKVNNVWFSGEFNATSLNINQYVWDSASYASHASILAPGVYFGLFAYQIFTITGPGFLYANATIDYNKGISYVSTEQYSSALYSESHLQSNLNVSAHVYGPVLFELSCCTSSPLGSPGTFNVKQYSKEDLLINGLAPKWVVSLQQV